MPKVVAKKRTRTALVEKTKSVAVVEEQEPKQVEEIPHPETAPVVVDDVLAAMEKYTCLINKPQSWDKLTNKVLGKLPPGTKPPQEWFEKNNYTKTLADIVNWCSYYTDGEEYYVLRNWEVSHYFGNLAIGETESCEEELTPTWKNKPQYLSSTQHQLITTIN